MEPRLALVIIRGFATLRPFKNEKPATGGKGRGLGNYDAPMGG
jgi:hypothetical protein